MMKPRFLFPRLFAAVAGLSIGCAALSQSSQGVTKDEILIGTIQDLSGPVASLGVTARDGFMMRIEEANAAGGIHGRKIRLLVEDNGYDPKRSVLAAQKLVTGEKVFTIIGHMGTPNNVAAMPILFENNVTNFMPLSGGRAMFEPPERLKIALVVPIGDLMEAAVRYMMKKKSHTRVCALYQDDEFGQEGLSGAEAALKLMGMSLTGRASYKRGATDFSSQVARLKGAGCTLVALGTNPRETAGVMLEAQKTDFKPDFVGAAGVYHLDVPQLGGKATEGLYSIHGVQILYADDASKSVRDWVATYKAKYKMDPTVTSVTAYIAMDIFVAAAMKAGPNLTTDSLIAAMESNVFPTKFTGGVQFKLTKTDRLGLKQATVAQIQNGRWVELGESVSFGDGLASRK